MNKHPALEEVYWAKERLSRFYRMRSVAQAAKELTRLTDSLMLSSVPELRRLRATLKKWRIPILNYWTSRLTNARVEGFTQLGQARQTTSLRLYLVYELQTQTPKCLRHLAFSG